MFNQQMIKEVPISFHLWLFVSKKCYLNFRFKFPTYIKISEIRSCGFARLVDAAVASVTSIIDLTIVVLLSILR